MLEKQCSLCKKIKDVSEFRIHTKAKDGLLSHCKKCGVNIDIKYTRTKKGLVTVIYGGQVSRSKKRGHILPAYTKQELKDWLFSKPLFHELFLEWERSDYARLLKPSVDRKKDDIHYRMDNIQLMTWKENKHKANMSTREGKLRHGLSTQKQVQQLTKDGLLIAIHISTREAERVTSISHSNISKCCSGKYSQAGGFGWEYSGHN